MTQVQAVDPAPIERALSAAGLELPANVRITLIGEADPMARATPRWVVAFAEGTGQVTIFPARVGSYPYQSLTSVVAHEVAHVALARMARDGPLPRWFHEGVAVSVESGWGLASDVRLLFASFSRPRLDDLRQLFAADSEHQSVEAYLLATAVIADVRDGRGADVPGRIARRVGDGVPFARAFELETGETAEAAAERAWARYRRWTAWLPMLTDGTVWWGGILGLAVVAFFVRRRQRARRRRQWDEDELGWSRID